MALTRIEPMFRRLPDARAYYRRHGLRMTLSRIAEEIWGGRGARKLKNAIESANDAGFVAADTRRFKPPASTGIVRTRLKNRGEKVALLREYIVRRPSRGLEISPDISPMMVSGDGITLQYLDFCTTEKLRKRAEDQGRDPGRVPHIDYVYDPQQLISECVGGKTFDFVLSSHVVEHVPNLIGHFRDVSRVLEDGGVYCFLAPDMSLCFDANKPPTTLGALIEAFVNDWKHAPLSAMIDEYRSAVWLGDKNAWSIDDSGIFSPKYKNWRALISQAIAKPSILKAWHGHIWRFTPETFVQLFTEIQSFGLLDLRIRAVVATHHMDFLCVMEKFPAGQ